MKYSSGILAATAAGAAAGIALGALFSRVKGSETHRDPDKKFMKFSKSLLSPCNKEKLSMEKAKLEQHKAKVEKHIEKINIRLAGFENAEAKVHG